jgi:hypothetical protein
VNCLPRLQQLTTLPASCCAARSRKRLDASTGQQRQEHEILEIAVRPGWKAGTKITFQEKGGRPPPAAACAAGGNCLWGSDCVRAVRCCVRLCLYAKPASPFPPLPQLPPCCASRRTAGDENPGRIAADIIFVLQEKPHPHFKREGNDLIYTHRWVGGGGARSPPCPPGWPS